MAPRGSVNSGCRDLRVDRLVRLDLAVAEIEERLPADEPARRPTPSAQVVGIGVALLVGVEHEGEERVAVVAGEVRPVRRADHAVAHPVRAGLELDRHERFTATGVEPTSAGGVAEQNLVGDLPADEVGEQLVDDDPLVVPGRQSTSFGERVGWIAHTIGTNGIDGVVVEQQEGALQAGDDHVLVVARIGDDCLHRRGPREVLEQPSGFETELDPVGGVVESVIGDRPVAVHRVEVEGRAAKVARVRRLRRRSEP